MAAGELIEQFTGHEDRVSRFIDKWRNKPDLIKLAKIYLRQLQDIEDAAFEVLLERDLDNAEEVQLETIGKLVGQPRTTSDDERYRTAIRARIAINLSDSTGEDVIRVANLLLVDEEAFELRDEPPAQLRVTITDPLTSADSDLVHSLLDEADAAGVRLLLQWEALPTSFAFAVSSPESDGTIELPAGLVYECATANTTAQISPTERRVGFVADVLRGFSRDGTTWTGLVEPAATNANDEPNLNNWTPTNNPILNDVVTPEGIVDTAEVQDASGLSDRINRVTATSALANETWALSVWWKKPDQAGNISALQVVRGAGFFPGLGVAETTVDADWRFISDVATNDATAGTLQLRAFPAASAAGDEGKMQVRGVMLEKRGYSTSHVDGSRVAGVFRYIYGRAITKSGYFSGSVTFQPHFADTALGLTDFHVCWLSNDARVTYDASAKTFRLWISGVVVHASDAVTFNAFDIVTVSFASLTTGTSLSTSGFATGDSTKTSATVQAPVVAVDDIYILGGPSGASEGFGFSAVSFDQEDLPKFTLGSTVGTPTAGGGLGSTTSGSTNPGKLSSVIGPEG